MRRPRSLAITLLALLGLAVAAPRSRAADDTIKIGYIDPFSGPFAAGGDDSLKMFRFIVDNINAQGGALGKKFELVHVRRQAAAGRGADRAEEHHRPEHARSSCTASDPMSARR